MSDVYWERYPFIAQLVHVRSWLQIQANLGLSIASGFTLLHLLKPLFMSFESLMELF